MSVQQKGIVAVQISEEQIIHSHTPLQMFPSLRKRHCVVIGQGPVVSIVREEYPFSVIWKKMFDNLVRHCFHVQFVLLSFS